MAHNGCHPLDLCQEKSTFHLYYLQGHEKVPTFAPCKWLKTIAKR